MGRIKRIKHRGSSDTIFNQQHQNKKRQTKNKLNYKQQYQWKYQIQWKPIFTKTQGHQKKQQLKKNYQYNNLVKTSATTLEEVIPGKELKSETLFLKAISDKVEMEGHKDTGTPEE